MTVSAGFQRSQFGPAPIAIKNHGHVVGSGEGANFFDNTAAVEPIKEALTEKNLQHTHRYTVVLSAGVSG
jgi:hypothetical protein